MDNQSGAGPSRPHRLNGHLVVLGIVLGLLATFVWMFLVFVVAFSGENYSSSVQDWAIFALFWLPLPGAVLLLCLRRTRQAAAGFVMGLAIGTIVLAGFCTSLMLPSLGA